MILSMAQCEVQRCTNEATGIVTLKERDAAVDLPREAAVCDAHREELSSEDAEWILEAVERPTGRHGRALLVGESLQGLNEYILLEQPTSIIGYGAGRAFSHQEHNGYHIRLHVRRRGDSEHDLTLVVPFDMLAGLVNLLQTAVPESQRKPKRGPAGREGGR